MPFPPLFPSEEVPFLLEVDRPLPYLTAIPMRLDVVVLSFFLQVLVVVVYKEVPLPSLLVSEKVSFLLNTKKKCIATPSVIIISYFNYNGTCLIHHIKGPEKCV